MAIFLGGKEPQWPNTVYPGAMYPHYNMQGYSPNHRPGFSNDDAAGSAIKITYTSDVISRFDYYNSVGTAITDGVWSGGFRATEVTDANVIMCPFMDESDAELYFLAVNTDTTPDQYKLCNVNKGGTLDQSFGWTTPSGASFDTNYQYTLGCLQRVSTDGNFFFAHPFANIGTARVAPYRGAKMTFAASDGALTESHLVDVATGQGSEGRTSGLFGPTSNNIYAGFFTNTGKDYGGDTNVGQIFNATNGKGFYINWPGKNQVNYPVDQMGTNHIVPMQWRDYYICTPTGAMGKPHCWEIDAMHSFWDEVAVQHGIL